MDACKLATTVSPTYILQDSATPSIGVYIVVCAKSSMPNNEANDFARIEFETTDHGKSMVKKTTSGKLSTSGPKLKANLSEPLLH